MTQEAPTLYPGPIDAVEPPGKGKHGYWKRSDNGWVVVASTNPSNKNDYEFKGYEFLQKYGEFANGTGLPRATQNEQDDRGNPWNPANEPWRMIFQRGGVEEFPVSQVLAYNWHITPPYKEVTFPQLEGVEVTNYACPECEKMRVFSDPNPAIAAGNLRTHLTSEISSSHRYSAGDLRDLGKDWDIDFDSARVGVRAVTVATPIPETDEPTEEQKKLQQKKDNLAKARQAKADKAKLVAEEAAAPERSD